MANILIYGLDSVTMTRFASLLRKEKHTVQICDTLDALPQDAKAPQLVMLDARLKWSDCRNLFEDIHQLCCPILFYTADRGMVSHLRTLYSGASDVLILPSSQKLLIAKVSALLNDEKPLEQLTLDQKDRVALLNGERVTLTAQEYALLLALLENADMPVSREQLLHTAWGYQSIGETRTVDVHVQRLRKKLGDERIETIYKCGYRLKMA